MSRFQRSPLAGSDMLRRGDNLNHLTTRQLRLQSNDGTFPAMNGVPRIAREDGTMGMSAATLTEDGSAHLPGTLTVEESTMMNGTLVVRGATDIKGDTDVGGKLSCAGITSTGVAVFNTNVVIQGDTIISGPTNVTGDSTIQNLTVKNEFITEGPVTVNNNITINNTMTVNAPTVFYDNVTMNGKVEIPNDLTVDRIHVREYVDDVTHVTSVNTDIVRAKGILVEKDDLSYTLTVGKVVDISGDVLIRNGTLELVDPSGNVILSSDQLGLTRTTGEKVALSGAGLALTDATGFAAALTLNADAVHLSTDVSNGSVSIETLEGGQIQLYDHSVGINTAPDLNYSLDVSGNTYISDGARAEYLILNPQAAPVAPQADPSMNPVDETLFPKTQYSAMWMDVSNNVWVGDHKIQMQHEIQVDSWFDKYLLAQPAAPADPSDNNTPAEVLIWWEKNPPQIDASFLLQKLPRIAKLRADFIGASGAGNLSVENTDQLPGTVAAVDAVRGIALVKGNGTPGVGSRTVNGTNVPVYVYYLGKGNQPPAEPFDVRIWFEGYGDTSRKEVLEVKGLSFKASSGPSAVRNVTAPNANITYNSATITYAIPQYSDNNAQLVPYNANDIATLANPRIVTYNVTITPTGSRRYPGPFNTNAVDASSNEPTRLVNYSSLLHDTTYSIDVYATNSTGNDGQRLSAPLPTFTTPLKPNLAPNLFVDRFNSQAFSSFFPGNSYVTDIYLSPTVPNGSNALGKPVIYAATSGYTLSSDPNGIGPLSIHVEDTRGYANASGSIMTLGVNVNPPNKTTSLSINGFGASNNQSVDSNHIRIAEASRTDISGGIDSGFYQTGKYTISLHPSNLGLYGQLITLTLTQSFAGNNPAAKSNLFQFYVDDLAPGSTPAVSISSAIRTSGITNVAGIPISNSSWALGSIDFSTTNMGKYYHTSNPITYNFAGSTQYETSLPGTRAVPYTVQGKSLSATASSYFYQPQLTITAKNTLPQNNSGQGSITITNMLLDPASITKAGQVTRIVSPANIIDMTTSGFDNNSIVNLRECILYNGSFVGRGSNKYIDYSPISGPNLSGQSSSGGIDGNGYRYVTLSFSGPGNTGKSNATITVSGTTNYTMYYRAVDGTRPSKWINGRTNTNINSINDPVYYGTTSTQTLGGFDTQKQACLFPTPFTATQVLVCVGIPDGEPNGVSGISVNYN